MLFLPMRFLLLAAILSVFEVSTALAQTAESAAGAAAEGPPGGIVAGLFRILPLFGIVFFIFYFLVLRPQEAKEREQRALIDSNPVGKWMLTIGGIIGRVSSVEEYYIVLDIGGGTQVKFEHSSIVKEVDGALLSSGDPSAKGKKARAKKK